MGGAQYRVEATGHVAATLVDSSCDVTNLTLVSVVHAGETDQ